MARGRHCKLEDVAIATRCSAESGVGGEKDSRHSAAAELAVESVGGSEGGLELGAEVGQTAW